MEIPVSRVTVSVAFVLVLVCAADAMNYLAFPRMGRSNYLAFPRMGRSQTKTDTVSDNCCELGLKSVIGLDVKEEELQSLCDSDAPCCDGLTEVVHQRPRGTFFSFCVPAKKDHTSEVFGTLKSLLRRK